MLLPSCQPAEIWTLAKPTNLQPKHIKNKSYPNYSRCWKWSLAPHTYSLHFHKIFKFSSARHLRIFQGLCWSLALILSSFSSVSIQHSGSDFLSNKHHVLMYLSVNSSVWSCNIRKFMPESACFSCRTAFHIDIIHEHSLFHYVSHMWYIDTAEWILIPLILSVL